MDARSGEVRAMASWPPVDPHRARDMTDDDPARLNRASGAVYELGSIFKPLTIAAAIEAGSVGPRDLFDVSTPLEINGFVIDDDHPIAGRASLTKIIAESSNIGTVKVNMMQGARRQKAFLQSLGLFEEAAVELAGSAAPLLPERWDDLSAATISYGHGIAVSPMAFLAAFSALGNDGELAVPTLVMTEQRKPQPSRVMSALTAKIVNAMMREAVVTGTGKRAEVAGYRVAGKTGTAEKPFEGGYDDERNITSFAAVFPQDRPQYALIVMFDEPQLVDPASVEAGAVGGVTAAWNAAPTAGRIIERVAPLLGLAPRFEDVRPEGLPFRSVSHERSDL
jgi:cell division protein FtsI (penicillin-binding protein 3)